MIPIRLNWMNGYLTRKLILFLYFRGQKRNEEILVFEGGNFKVFVLVGDGSGKGGLPRRKCNLNSLLK